MLPGFRFLFAAIALSISTVVFGLGAAALLRASHDRFASLEAWPPAPALPLSAASPRETEPPTLALLQTDPPEAAAIAPPADHAPPVIDGAIVPDTVNNETTAPEPSPSAAQAEPPVAANEPVSAFDTAAAPPSEAAVATPPATPSLDAATAIAIETIPAEPPPASAPEPAAIAEKSIAFSREADAGSGGENASNQQKEARPAPIMPTDAPIRTALLATDEPAPAASADPAVAITGPIPLPRARNQALARSHKASQTRARKRIARARPQQAVARPAAPPAAPTLPFLFGE